MATPRKIAERLAADLHISSKALADAKIESGMTWQEIIEQLQKQIAMADQYSAGFQVDTSDIDDDLPDVFSYYHRD